MLKPVFIKRPPVSLEGKCVISFKRIDGAVFVAPHLYHCINTFGKLLIENPEGDTFLIMFLLVYSFAVCQQLSLLPFC